MGYLSRRRGDWQTALENLKRAQSLNPREVEATHEVGLTLMCMREYDDALPYFERLLEVVPDHYDAVVYSGVIHHERGETERAEELLCRAVELEPPALGDAAGRQLAALALVAEALTCLRPCLPGP